MTEDVLDRLILKFFASRNIKNTSLLTTSSNNSWLSSFEASPGHYLLLQPIWDLRLGHESIVASPLFPIVFSLTFYFMCVLPFMFLDTAGRNWNWIQKYKIQTDREVTWPQIRRAVILTAWNHVMYILPLTVAQCVWTPLTVLPTHAPGTWEFIWQHYASLALFDLLYYSWHFTHHKVRFLYRNVHSVHHHYSSPSSWVSEYLHPYELITIGFFTNISPMIFGAHPLTQWSFTLVTILVSVEAHSGYDLPISPQHWAPFWGGAVHHDMHHQKPLTNFQPFFNWFDRLFGSYCPGQMAGGHRPKELLDWEKVSRVAETEFGEADSTPIKPKQL